MSLQLLCSAVVCLAVGAPASAQDASKPTYEQLLEQVKKSDPDVDFAALRMAFTETEQYNPYNVDRELRRKMEDALDEKDYVLALDLAEKALAKNYLDIEAHYVASSANQELGKTDEYKFHSFVYVGLVKSMLKSGDGKSAKTAYVVISVDEEYSVLDRIGIRRGEQELMEVNGQFFDLLHAVDRRSEKPVDLWFNVTVPWKWFQEDMKKAGG